MHRRPKPIDPTDPRVQRADAMTAEAIRIYEEMERLVAPLRAQRERLLVDAHLLMLQASAQ